MFLRKKESVLKGISMSHAQWIREIPGNPVTLAFMVALIELLLILPFFMVISAGYWYWRKKKQGRYTHAGYIRFALLYAMSSGAIAGFVVSDFYNADGFYWLAHGWLAGSALTLLLIIIIFLIVKHSKLQNIPSWLDPRIGGDS